MNPQGKNEFLYLIVNRCQKKYLIKDGLKDMKKSLKQKYLTRTYKKTSHTT